MTRGWDKTQDKAKPPSHLLWVRRKILLYTNRAKAFVFREFGGSRKRSILVYVMTESREGVVSPTMREVKRSV
ncbi:hypothetical protein, partial [Listeria riparia]|uniref:hypothetical protein n=1 Tax=Listeria riparia TaxID=1494964 RepID=UPI0019D397C2